MIPCWIVLCVPFLVADPPTEVITLKSGEVLRGTVVERTDDQVVFDHPVLGRLTLPTGQVVSVVSVEDADAAAPPQAEPPEPPPPAPEPPKWKSRFDLGFTGTAGVSEDTNLLISFKTEYDSPEIRHRIDASYLLSTAGGDRENNKATAGDITEWKIPESRWSYFAQGRYDYDEFQSWDQRLQGHGGLGYLLVDVNDDVDGHDVFDLTVRAGAGLRKEFGSDNDDLVGEGLVGAELAWNIVENQSLSAGTTVYPSFSELEDIRVVTFAEYVVKIDTMRGINMTSGFKWEWDGVTDPGVSPNDLTVYVAMGLAF